MRLAILAAALLLGACGGTPSQVTGPSETRFTAHGLEQQLTVRAPVPADPDPGWLHLSSRLVNRSDAPITVRVVTCWLDPKQHLRTRAEFNGYAIPGCIPEPNVLTLAPGEASRSVGFSGRISRPGRYTIQVRHALDPEFWSEIEVTAR
jgi:hypothetical protein